MADSPVFVGTLKNYTAAVTNTTTAADIADSATGKIDRIENLVFYNGHSASADVELIMHNGTAAITVFRKTALAAYSMCNVLQEMFGYDSKQFIIIPDGYKLQLKTPTAVAGAVSAFGNGGEI